MLMFALGFVLGVVATIVFFCWGASKVGPWR